ncbi:HEPN domain-containing protein [Candidatus Micrarchaeota archaeon]|nr:HEPN domain-containing protein [Candidatus Micrarchaeota archaeon]
MNLSELLGKSLVKKIEPDEKTASGLLCKAEEDVAAAEDNYKLGRLDWALAIAYNAMLSAGRALMAWKGYRAASEAHHLAVVQFCAAMMPADTCDLVTSFNRYRVRRHDVVYGEGDSVGEAEAKRAISRAKEFISKIREKCRKS